MVDLSTIFLGGFRKPETLPFRGYPTGKKKHPPNPTPLPGIPDSWASDSRINSPNLRGPDRCGCEKRPTFPCWKEKKRLDRLPINGYITSTNYWVNDLPQSPCVCFLGWFFADSKTHGKSIGLMTIPDYWGVMSGLHSLKLTANSHLKNRPKIPRTKRKREYSLPVPSIFQVQLFSFQGGYLKHEIPMVV